MHFLFLKHCTSLCRLLIQEQQIKKMGSIITKPNTEKNCEYQNHNLLQYASCSMRGWRPFMQDAHISNYPLEGNLDLGLFAVFDGHGGPQVSIFAKQHFTKCLITNKNFIAKDYEKALVQAFINLDDLMTTNLGKKEILKIRHQQVQVKNGLAYQGDTVAGATALVILITKQFIYCANAGDSLSVVSLKSKDNKYEARQLNIEHKPTISDEKKRILAAGGRINSQGRINENLNLSRALGDFSFKSNKDLSIREQIVICVPDVVKIERNCVQFIIMGCDGIWQNKDGYGMVKWIKKRMEQGKNISKILSKLLDEEVGSGFGNDGTGLDNMTAILILLNQ